MKTTNQDTPGKKKNKRYKRDKQIKIGRKEGKKAENKSSETGKIITIIIKWNWTKERKVLECH